MLKIISACAADFEEMWPTMQEIFASGDSFAHLPDTPKQTARDYFMGLVFSYILPGTMRDILLVSTESLQFTGD